MWKNKSYCYCTKSVVTKFNRNGFETAHNCPFSVTTDASNKDKPSLIEAKCNTHVLHNMAKYALLLLPLDVETLVIKTYNEFSSSGKKVLELQALFEFLEQEYSNLIKHLPIRWLNLSPALDRLLLNWDPGKSYFISKGMKLYIYI
jgi:hypothetical protein